MSTKAKAAAAKDEDGEEKSKSTDQRGGKTPTSAKPAANKADPNVIPLDSKDPKALRKLLAGGGVSV